MVIVEIVSRDRNEPFALKSNKSILQQLRLEHKYGLFVYNDNKIKEEDTVESLGIKTGDEIGNLCCGGLFSYFDCNDPDCQKYK